MIISDYAKEHCIAALLVTLALTPRGHRSYRGMFNALAELYDDDREKTLEKIEWAKEEHDALQEKL